MTEEGYEIGRWYLHFKVPGDLEDPKRNRVVFAVAKDKEDAKRTAAIFCGVLYDQVDWCGNIVCTGRVDCISKDSLP